MQRWTYRYAHTSGGQKSILSFIIIPFICIFVLYVHMILWEDMKRATLSLFTSSTLTKFVINPSQQNWEASAFCLLGYSHCPNFILFLFFEIGFESLAEPRACQFSRTNWPGSAYVYLSCTGITSVQSCSELFNWVLGVWTQILTALGTKSDGVHLPKPSAPISVLHMGKRAPNFQSCMSDFASSDLPLVVSWLFKTLRSVSLRKHCSLQELYPLNIHVLLLSHLRTC